MESNLGMLNKKTKCPTINESRRSFQAYSLHMYFQEQN